ncbi:50S ribosomal protein L23 [Tumebacillus flagellatus]|uniref:Large ribosomal subunit protein uL23 n=1 Tax=Tumebacillus flagellatus TaxID=1157490 RepID=A0A074M6V1_9BACL|nr:50S ribosomal protein L23 [Tumebacillus flagellatus]KEO81737.1 50S ribosomal protein L23 [Tumebacillus flagellatus]
MSKNPRDIIKRPVITERTTDLMEENKFAFEVDLKANKTEIKKAIEEIFGVTVEKVNTLRVPSKKKRVGRFVGRTSEWKKAIVTLTSDSKPLNFFEGA